MNAENQATEAREALPREGIQAMASIREPRGRLLTEITAMTEAQNQG